MSNNLTLPYQRFGVGFDRLFNELDRLMTVSNPGNGGYPPFNLEKPSDNHYRITMAVAGFTEQEIDVTHQENTLVVTGEKTAEDTTNYLHRGIATRSFKREFVLGEHVEVKSASLKDGMLVIDLEQIIPEEHKPKKIPLIKE
jgi:molecular chaperone IbpA